MPESRNTKTTLKVISILYYGLDYIISNIILSKYIYVDIL